MNISEHVEVFSSLITGLAVGDLAISLHRLLVERRKVRWDWLVLLAASLQLLSLLQSWWASFDAYGHTKTLSIAHYLPEVILLILLFLQTAAILPDKIPEEAYLSASTIGQWRDTIGPPTWCFSSSFSSSTGRASHRRARRCSASWSNGI